MGIYFWIVLIIVIVLYLYINRNKKQKRDYFRATMISLQTKGVSSDQLLQKLSAVDSGKILVRCFNEKKSPENATNILLMLYKQYLSEKSFPNLTCSAPGAEFPAYKKAAR